MFCASLFSTLLTIWSLWQWKRASLQNAGCAASTSFQCNERVIVPPRLDALTEQISAAALTIYSKCYTTHMQEKIGWWTRDAGIKSNTYILTILDTNDVCVANKQTCNLKWWCINNDDFVPFNQGSKMPIKQMAPFLLSTQMGSGEELRKKKKPFFGSFC